MTGLLDLCWCVSTGRSASNTGLFERVGGREVRKREVGFSLHPFVNWLYPVLIHFSNRLHIVSVWLWFSHCSFSEGVGRGGGRGGRVGGG